MSDTNKTENMPPSTLALTDSLRTPKITQAQAAMPLTINSSSSTPTIAAGSMSRLRAPTNFSGISGSFTKIGRICSHSAPKAGPPPRDHGAVLTQDTEQFIIGQKVWVGGIRPGQIAYIGETHFAPGEWAGIVLDEPNGKNDGCVAGKRYFQCEPRRGIFSRLTRLTLTPLTGMHTPTSPITKMSPDRSRTVSPTISLRSPGKNGFTVGDRIIVSSGFGSRPGILRYLGETRFASGNWCGVELDEPSGKNDGSVDGVMYFECKPNYGIFVPIAKVSLSPSSKRTRLSKRGSRESLNSIGTINSTATTNTSRLRSNAQRIPLSIKPVVATPKSQYSVQDILAEKQKHIEQLMIERELDREDTQNQALQYQKNINEVIIYEDTLYAPVVYADKKRPFRLTRLRLSTIPRPASHVTRSCRSPNDTPATKRSSLAQQWTPSRSPTPPTKKVWFCDNQNNKSININYAK